MFFHTFLKSRNKHNGIYAFVHFKNRLQESFHSRPKLEGVEFNRIFVEDNSSLEVPFSLIDMKEVIWNSRLSLALWGHALNWLLIDLEDEWKNGLWCWNLRFNPELSATTIFETEDLFNILTNICPAPNAADILHLISL
ncbi:hypothetical protein KIW84_013795 [Lathyrus oleraceus]|uniref:Uncharacterized protein n=1 Tax=Pisum sativum TaxID=3888 RepID=A0A9D5BLE0_PEA|nr:hypothetical protein KIW84_013795 [Pisum sativum]